MHMSWARAAILFNVCVEGLMMSRLATEYKHPTLWALLAGPSMMTL